MKDVFARKSPLLREIFVGKRPSLRDFYGNYAIIAYYSMVIEQRQQMYL